MEKEKVLTKATVCYLIKKDEEGRVKILLAFKTRKIGKYCWSGYGGGVKKGEKFIGTARRELKEETDRDKTKGVIALPENMKKIAIVHAHNTMKDGKTFICEVHYYSLRKWKGEINETDEMIFPTLFSIYNLPKMMPGDKDWLFLALTIGWVNKIVEATVYYGPNQKTLLKPTEVKIVDYFGEE